MTKPLRNHVRLLVFPLALFQLSWFVRINLEEASSNFMTLSCWHHECGDGRRRTESSHQDPQACGGATSKKDPALPPALKNATSIRRWGCNLQDAPFIFSHIGKAGGGNVRARLAASAVDYQRPDWFQVDKDPTYYYPIHSSGPDGKTILHKGHFASSTIPNMVPTDGAEAFQGDYELEGMVPCGATTLLGQAIACPLVNTQCQERNGTADSNSDRCDLVYASHSLLGSEFHWLPTEFLSKWWRDTIMTQEPVACSPRYGASARIAKLLKARHDDLSGQLEASSKISSDRLAQCSIITSSSSALHLSDMESQRFYKDHYETCFQPREQAIDALVQQLRDDQGLYNARLISSLPVLRVTVLREPFSWLLSKFFWHDKHPVFDSGRRLQWVSPDRGSKRNIDHFLALKKKNRGNPPSPMSYAKCDDHKTYNWVTLRATSYILYLCGQHCLGEYAKMVSSSTNGDVGAILQAVLPSWERQAAFNLRNSFAVVGLLHETDQFYHMVSQRVAYMDTSLNPQAKGERHASSPDANREATRCRKRFASKEFQQELMSKSPAVAALQRLYDVAVEVNRFQKEELNECSAM